MKRVTYAKFLGVIFLVPAIFIIGVGLYIGPNLSTVSGVLILIFAILYLVNPAATYDDDKIEVKNLYGITLKTYYYKKDDFSIRENKIYVNGKKLKVSAAMCVPSEFQELIEHIKAKTSGDELEPSQNKTTEQDDILDSGL